MFLASCSNGIKKDIPTSSPVKTVAPIEAVQSEPVSIKTPIGDGGIITGYPCVAPCFIGIYPGKTQFDEAISILAKTDVGDCKKNETDFIISCDDDLFLGADFQTRIVNSIEYYPLVDITVGQVILGYGTPNDVIVIPLGVPETPFASIILLFDNYNMRVDLPNQDGVEYPVEESTEIEFVVYYDDNKYAELKGNYFSQIWDGYKVYTPLYK